MTILQMPSIRVSTVAEPFVQDTPYLQTSALRQHNEADATVADALVEGQEHLGANVVDVEAGPICFGVPCFGDFVDEVLLIGCPS